MKTTILALIFVLTTGCAGSFEEARLATPHRPAPAEPPGGTRVALMVDTRSECISLDGTHRTWGGIAKGAGAVTVGLGALEVPDMGKEARIGVGVGALVTGAVAAASVFISEDAATSWARDCR
jgi:hypothetical protein